MEFFKGLSDLHKGILSIVVGLILLMHTLNLTSRTFDVIFLLGSIYLIVQGSIKAGLHKKIEALVNRYRQ